MVIKLFGEKNHCLKIRVSFAVQYYYFEFKNYYLDNNLLYKSKVFLGLRVAKLCEFQPVYICQQYERVVVLCLTTFDIIF